MGKRRKLSDYGNQLFAKQKLRFYYGDITEKQFRKIYDKASRIKGDTSEILIELLERRLDAIVYRMKFVPTIFAARQLVNHGHVKVNGKRVNIPSYTVKDGDEISIKEQSKQINLIQEAIVSQEREIPEYLEVDTKDLKGRFLRAPLMHDVPYPVTMEPNLVIEYYSR
jgi:small subunit ribosomal protein S4